MHQTALEILKMQLDHDACEVTVAIKLLRRRIALSEVRQDGVVISGRRRARL